MKVVLTLLSDEIRESVAMVLPSLVGLLLCYISYSVD